MITWTCRKNKEGKYSISYGVGSVRKDAFAAVRLQFSLKTENFFFHHDVVTSSGNFSGSNPMSIGMYFPRVKGPLAST
jgi:hypothetical protein